MRVDLKSKLIEGVVYSAETQRLTLYLTSGQRREYANVPSEVYNGLLSARSAGTYYQESIKPHFDLAE